MRSCQLLLEAFVDRIHQRCLVIALLVLSSSRALVPLRLSLRVRSHPSAHSWLVGCVGVLLVDDKNKTKQR